jgi:glutathione S-transferase
MNIVLYGRPFNRSDRVQWLFEELQLEYEYRVLEVFDLEHRSEEIKRKYPLTRLPFVEINGDVMFESGAIMLYFAGKFKEETDLLPEANEKVYREILQWLFFAISTLEISDGSLESGADPGPSAPLVDTLQFVDGVLENKRFIAGGSFSVADIALANGFKWFDRSLLNKYKNIVSYCSDHMSRPAFKKILSQAKYPDRAKNLF